MWNDTEHNIIGAFRDIYISTRHNSRFLPPMSGVIQTDASLLGSYVYSTVCKTPHLRWTPVAKVPYDAWIFYHTCPLVRPP